MRNNDLLNARNNKIYVRYKELYDIQFLRHEKVLELLSIEFYLGTVSIEKIVLNAKKDTSNKSDLQASQIKA
jgi:hypothetical protein